MGHARRAIDLIHRADTHPQHVGHGGRAVIGFDNHRHAVGQGELLDLGRRSGLGDSADKGEGDGQQSA